MRLAHISTILATKCFSRFQQGNYENRALNFVIKSALNSTTFFKYFLTFNDCTKDFLRICTSLTIQIKMILRFSSLFANKLHFATEDLR